MLKKTIMGLGFAALLASPALAQSYDPDLGTGNVMTPPSAVYNAPAGIGTPEATVGTAGGPFAYAPQRLHTPRVRHRTQRQEDEQER